MPRCIAFLRAINVGGHTVTMDALRGHFVDLGIAAPETFIASGNVIFTTRARSLPALETKIERHLEAALGYAVATFLRTDVELAAIVAHADALPAATAHNVGFLKAPLTAPQRRALAGLETAIDRFHLHGHELHWLCDAEQSDSTFSNAVFEKTLGQRATFRGLNTLRRLVAKYPAT
ncbi:MAG: DUF1697 domain-containing protein [Candidatus Krumholzibacteriia bacterium]|nr:DUF1697 domain-containing protein [bacterium]MCB9514269.1 DUF1697 domain-containing protein [Candidatus Latescibacterota bacterium]MCB9516714.1 DUF1697 domain-containing protein [Candidatus Latescibacterota bacterium]